MKIKRFVSVLLCTIVLIYSSTLPSSATSYTDSSERSEVAVSNRAGKNGSYYYTPATNTATYIPPEATLEDMNIDVSNPQSVSSSANLSLYEIDPELEDIMDSIMASDDRFAVNNPSGYELSTCLLGARFDKAGVKHVESKNECITGVHSGTGWLINNTYLVTAGHMVYDWEHINNGNDGWAKHVAIYVGASNGNFIHYSLSDGYDAGGDYVSCKSMEDYTNLGLYDDWAIIKLKTPVPSGTYMPKLTPKETNSASEILNKAFTTQGYPFDLNFGKYGNVWDNYTMYKQTNGTIYADYPQPYTLDVVASTDIMFTSGQSGSALYANGVARAIGVYAESDAWSDLSCFVLINYWLYDHIYSNYM